MPEQAALLGGLEDRPARQLGGAAHVMQKRRGEEQVGAQALVELRELAADRRDTDRVLEEPAGVAVVAVDRRGQRAEARAQLVVADEPPDRGLQSRVRDLRGEELEKPSSSSPSRRMLGASASGSRSSAASIERISS